MIFSARYVLACAMMLYGIETNAQDFTIPITVDGRHFLGDQGRIQKACKHVRTKNNMTASKATTLTLWLGLCQQELVKKHGVSQHLFAAEGGEYYQALPDGKPDKSAPVTYEDMVLQFYIGFGSLNLNKTLSDGKVSLAITHFPLITYGADSASNTVKVWTDFPTIMPIPSLLNEPAARDLFCQSATFPSDEYTLSEPRGYASAGCNLDGDDEEIVDTEVKVPKFPPVPLGRTPSERARNAVCHELRISAAKFGKISSDDLIAWTALEFVPIFSKKGDPNSELMGTQECTDLVVGNKIKNLDYLQFDNIKGEIKQQLLNYWPSNNQEKKHWLRPK